GGRRLSKDEASSNPWSSFSFSASTAAAKARRYDATISAFLFITLSLFQILSRPLLAPLQPFGASNLMPFSERRAHHIQGRRQTSCRFGGYRNRTRSIHYPEPAFAYTRAVQK